MAPECDASVGFERFWLSRRAIFCIQPFANSSNERSARWCAGSGLGIAAGGPARAAEAIPKARSEENETRAKRVRDMDGAPSVRAPSPDPAPYHKQSGGSGVPIVISAT